MLMSSSNSVKQGLFYCSVGGIKQICVLIKSYNAPASNLWAPSNMVLGIEPYNIKYILCAYNNVYRCAIISGPQRFFLRNW